LWGDQQEQAHRRHRPPGRIGRVYRRDTRGPPSHETGHNQPATSPSSTPLWSLIEDGEAHLPFDFRPELVKEQARLISIPAANFLYNGFDSRGWRRSRDGAQTARCSASTRSEETSRR
jgi:hypothetical protein